MGARDDLPERPSYPTGTLHGSIRQPPAAATGWKIIDGSGAAENEAAALEPALTAAAIMKNALTAMLAQANVGRRDAMRMLLL